MEALVEGVKAVGFPIVVALWLLYRQTVERRKCDERLAAMELKIDFLAAALDRARLPQRK